MSEFCFHLISWEQINGFWRNFVYAVLWLAHEIFLNFSTESWPLIDDKISNFRNNKWDFDKILFMHRYIWSMLWLMHIIFPTFQQSYAPWLILELCLCSISCEMIGGYLEVFYAKTCATTKKSTVAHVVLATLLFNTFPIFQQIWQYFAHNSQ